MEGNVFFHEISVTDNLITGYMASGVNLTGMFLRLLYGTREVAIVLLTGKGSRRVGMARDSGGGLTRSSYEAGESRGSEGVSLFSF